MKKYIEKRDRTKSWSLALNEDDNGDILLEAVDSSNGDTII
jgi:hypothetical protein